MADRVDTGKFLNSRSVPNSPVTEPVHVSEFLNKTPIPNPVLKTTKWVQGAPTPIQKGLMSPNTETINLIAGFASEHVTMEGDDLKHIPSISKSLREIWETPKSKNIFSGGTLGTKKATIAQKEPHKNVSKQIAQKEPHTRVPDSEIKLSNIIPGSPAFVPYRRVTPKGKGKGRKNIQIGENSEIFDSEIARSKRTMTKEERLKAKVKEQNARVRAKCAER